MEKRFLNHRLAVDNVRIRSILDRSYEKSMNGHKLIEVIAGFESVEKFQAWKNQVSDNTAYVIERVGGNNYRTIRNAYRMFGLVRA